MAGEASEFWDAQVERFDEEPDHGLLDGALRRAWANLLLPLMPSPQCLIADIGCGTGSLSVLLAQAGHSVCGVDFSAGMIAAAREKAEGAGVAVDFVKGDAATPPWPTASFDVVLARHVLWALDDPAAALRRWVELLKPKPTGLLVLIEGSWSTGAGLPAAETARLVRATQRTATVQRLDDDTLWGKPVTDERYLLISRT